MKASGRRKFLQKTGSSLAGLSLFPHFSTANFDFGLGPFQDNEAYWELVRKQFSIPANLIMANSANLCSPPFQINDRVQQFVAEMNKDVSFQNRAVFSELRKTAIEKVSGYLGADVSEIGITRNTTEGNNIIVNGLELESGDEVVIWDQNHPSNRESWEDKARRSGFSVKRINTPKKPGSKDELLKTFTDAITPNTRLLAFSHISNVSGIALPVKEICTFARERKILTLVDGAQACGFMDLDLQDIDCDFYTTSTHKWMLGPLENGILYIKSDQIMNIWPDSITVFWEAQKNTADDRFCSLGQRNETTPPAIIDTIDFHLSIGKKNVERRVRQLASHLKTNIQRNIPQAQFVTPLSEDLSGGVVIIQLPGKDPREVFEKLYSDYRIVCAPTGGIRLSPTLSATLRDMDKIVEALTALS